MIHAQQNWHALFCRFADLCNYISSQHAKSICLPRILFMFPHFVHLFPSLPSLSLTPGQCWFDYYHHRLVLFGWHFIQMEPDNIHFFVCVWFLSVCVMFVRFTIIMLMRGMFLFLTEYRFISQAHKILLIHSSVGKQLFVVLLWVMLLQKSMFKSIYEYMLSFLQLFQLLGSVTWCKWLSGYVQVYHCSQGLCKLSW